MEKPRVDFGTRGTCLNEQATANLELQLGELQVRAAVSELRALRSTQQQLQLALAGCSSVAVSPVEETSSVALTARLGKKNQRDKNLD